MTLPLAAMPAAISESVAVALKAHGLSFSPDLLSEIGRNVAQALCALDETPDDASPPPEAGDLFSVGHTVRMLARTAPGEGTRAVMTRVGDWLVEQAAEAMAKAAKPEAA